MVGVLAMKHASVDRAKRVSTSCRNNGSCPWCARSRTMDRQRVRTDVELRESVDRDEVLTADEWASFAGRANDYRARSGAGGD